MWRVLCVQEVHTLSLLFLKREFDFKQRKTFFQVSPVLFRTTGAQTRDTK